ncbi:hypothetical protein Dda_9058 [Drechslerella dactyloides]|uniref:Uncharacterized protein n=1 Tax=Drechslerella dactyloides TaxID=74499 RepID=A0AAD6NGZ2_DREDA|nr:hypothetical protein Dda_9058 [Drechslerella dactyloides]
MIYTVTDEEIRSYVEGNELVKDFVGCTPEEIKHIIQGWKDVGTILKNKPITSPDDYIIDRNTPEAIEFFGSQRTKKYRELVQRNLGSATLFRTGQAPGNMSITAKCTDPINVCKKYVYAFVIRGSTKKDGFMGFCPPYFGSQTLPMIIKSPPLLKEIKLNYSQVSLDIDDWTDNTGSVFLHEMMHLPFIGTPHSDFENHYNEGLRERGLPKAENFNIKDIRVNNAFLDIKQEGVAYGGTRARALAYGDTDGYGTLPFLACSNADNYALRDLAIFEDHLLRLSVNVIPSAGREYRIGIYSRQTDIPNGRTKQPKD